MTAASSLLHSCDDWRRRPRLGLLRRDPESLSVLLLVTAGEGSSVLNFDDENEGKGDSPVRVGLTSCSREGVGEPCDGPEPSSLLTVLHLLPGHYWRRRRGRGESRGEGGRGEGGGEMEGVGGEERRGEERRGEERRAEQSRGVVSTNPTRSRNQTYSSSFPWRP
jgi:hypothetical protein